MSKAFTGESDNEEMETFHSPALPPGTRNYITPAGARQLEEERERLIAEKAALGKEDHVDARRRKQFLEHRLEFLNSRLNAADVIDPARQPAGQVLFGATVTVRDQASVERTWRIVGVDEVDVKRGWISWMSPLARALLEKKTGDTVDFQNQLLTLLKITYLE